MELSLMKGTGLPELLCLEFRLLVHFLTCLLGLSVTTFELFPVRHAGCAVARLPMNGGPKQDRIRQDPW